MNIKKRFSGFLIIAITILLTITGCSNPLMPMHEEDSVITDTTGTGGQGALTITVGEEASSRTILPTTPSFTKYRLEFSGPASVDPVESTETSFDAVYLDPGEWTITAYGYSMFGGSEAAVAEGSGTVTVSAGSNDSLELSISAQQTGGTPGTFEYSLSVPEAFNGMIDAYDVSYHPYGDSSSPASDSGAISYSGAGFTYSGSDDIEPGYYLATVQVSSADYSATKMEIVHIYSNMVSSGSFDFAESDIMPVATLSGSLEILTMGVAQDESGWIVEAYTDPDYAADSIIGSAATDGSSNWSMDVEALTPAADIYFRANGTDDSSDYYDRPVISASPVTFGSTDITGIALSENIGQITISGTLAYTADGVSGADLEDWTITPYFDNGNYYDVMYDYSVNTDASGNWSFTIGESDFNPSELLGFYIRKWNAGAEFYDGSAISLEYSDITLNLDLELITLSGSLSHTINSIAISDFSEYDIAVYSEDNNFYSKYGNCTAALSGNWSMLVPASSANRDMYFEIYSIDNFEKEFHTSLGTISDSAVTGTSVDLGSSVSVSGTVEVILNEATQDLTTWSYSNLEFYTSPEYSQESQVSNFYIQATTGTAESWSVVLPAQDPTGDIYVLFNGTDGSMEYYNNLDAGSFSLGTSPLTDQALTVEQGMVTVSGTLSGTMNGSALSITEEDWTVQLYPNGGGDSFYAFVETDGSWAVTMPESETPVDYDYLVSCSSEGYYSSDPEGSISVSTSDITGLSIELNLVQISGTIDVSIEGVSQDLSTWNNCSLMLSDSSTPYGGSSNYYTTVTPGSPATWLATIEVQDPATDLYAFFNGEDGSSNNYNMLEAGMISSVGSSEITGQALTVDSSSITISGTLQLNVNGSATAVSDGDWNIIFFEDLDLENNVGSCSVAADSSWSIGVEAYSSDTELYYVIQGNSYGYVSIPTGTDSITVNDNNLTAQTISLDIVEISGTLTAGTDAEGFSNYTSWSCASAKEESKLLLLAMQGATSSITDENWSIHVDASESGTVDYTVGFIGGTDTTPFGDLYKTTVSVGQSAITGISVEYSELERWGCSLSGTISTGSTGTDFNNGYYFYMLDNETYNLNTIVGVGIIDPTTGYFTAQLYKNSTDYNVWYFIYAASGQWISDESALLGSSDASGLSLSMDNFTSF